MQKLNFKKFFEATDIFGFEPNRSQEEKDDNLLTHPINQFDIELMMDLLSQKRISNQEPFMKFLHEIQWGHIPGSMKLEVDTGYTFYIKRLAIDKEGNPRWLTKKMFQLNRQGYGGLEDKVAQEIFENLERYSTQNIETPVDDYKDLENLTSNIYEKLKRTSKIIFIPEGVRKLSDDAYIIKFGVRGHGLESAGQYRVEQNQTLISYDRKAGTIRLTNYNVESPVAAHTWSIGLNDLDLYFFPSQDRDEISETIAVHMKYY